MYNLKTFFSTGLRVCTIVLYCYCVTSFAGEIRHDQITLELADRTLWPLRDSSERMQFEHARYILEHAWQLPCNESYLAKQNACMKLASFGPHHPPSLALLACDELVHAARLDWAVGKLWIREPPIAQKLCERKYACYANAYSDLRLASQMGHAPSQALLGWWLLDPIFSHVVAPDRPEGWAQESALQLLQVGMQPRSFLYFHPKRKQWEPMAWQSVQASLGVQYIVQSLVAGCQYTLTAACKGDCSALQETLLNKQIPLEIQVQTLVKANLNNPDIFKDEQFAQQISTWSSQSAKDADTAYVAARVFENAFHTLPGLHATKVLFYTLAIEKFTAAATQHPASYAALAVLLENTPLGNAKATAWLEALKQCTNGSGFETDHKSAIRVLVDKAEQLCQHPKKTTLTNRLAHEAVATIYMSGIPGIIEPDKEHAQKYIIASVMNGMYCSRPLNVSLESSDRVLQSCFLTLLSKDVPEPLKESVNNYALEHLQHSAQQGNARAAGYLIKLAAQYRHIPVKLPELDMLFTSYTALLQKEPELIDQLDLIPSLMQRFFNGQHADIAYHTGMLAHKADELKDSKLTRATSALSYALSWGSQSLQQKIVTYCKDLALPQVIDESLDHLLEQEYKKPGTHHAILAQLTMPIINWVTKNMRLSQIDSKQCWRLYYYLREGVGRIIHANPAAARPLLIHLAHKANDNDAAFELAQVYLASEQTSQALAEYERLLSSSDEKTALKAREKLETLANQQMIAADLVLFDHASSQALAPDDKRWQHFFEPFARAVANTALFKTHHNELFDTARLTRLMSQAASNPMAAYAFATAHVRRFEASGQAFRFTPEWIDIFKAAYAFIKEKPREQWFGVTAAELAVIVAEVLDAEGKSHEAAAYFEPYTHLWYPQWQLGKMLILGRLLPENATLEHKQQDFKRGYNYLMSACESGGNTAPLRDLEWLCTMPEGTLARDVPELAEQAIPHAMAFLERQTDYSSILIAQKRTKSQSPELLEGTNAELLNRVRTLHENKMHVAAALCADQAAKQLDGHAAVYSGYYYACGYGHVIDSGKALTFFTQALTNRSEDFFNRTERGLITQGLRAIVYNGAMRHQYQGLALMLNSCKALYTLPLKVAEMIQLIESAEHCVRSGNTSASTAHLLSSSGLIDTLLNCCHALKKDHAMQSVLIWLSMICSRRLIEPIPGYTQSPQEIVDYLKPLHTLERNILKMIANSDNKKKVETLKGIMTQELVETLRKGVAQDIDPVITRLLGLLVSISGVDTKIGLRLLTILSDESNDGMAYLSRALLSWYGPLINNRLIKNRNQAADALTRATNLNCPHAWYQQGIWQLTGAGPLALNKKQALISFEQGALVNSALAKRELATILASTDPERAYQLFEQLLQDSKPDYNNDAATAHLVFTCFAHNDERVQRALHTCEMFYKQLIFEQNIFLLTVIENNKLDKALEQFLQNNQSSLMQDNQVRARMQALITVYRALSHATKIKGDAQTLLFDECQKELAQLSGLERGCALFGLASLFEYRGGSSAIIRSLILQSVIALRDYPDKNAAMHALERMYQLAELSSGSIHQMTQVIGSLIAH